MSIRLWHLPSMPVTNSRTVAIYDGDYWRHSLLRAGVFLDRFATKPDYFTAAPFGSGC